MSDDKSEKPKALDISKLQGGGLSKETREALRKSTAGLSAVSEAARKAMLGLDPLLGRGALPDAMTVGLARDLGVGVGVHDLKNLAGMYTGAGVADHLKKSLGVMGETPSQALGRALENSTTTQALRKLDDGGLRARMQALGVASGHESALGKIANDIAERQDQIDSLKVTSKPGISPPSLNMTIAPNPIHETNKRLERIEVQFESVGVIAQDALQTANELQGAAATFLDKFEKAAEDTNESGKAAVTTAKFALGIAVVIGTVQILLAAFGPDSSAEALQQSVSDMQGEIVRLRVEQEQTSQKLIDALARGDQATASAVREVLKQVKPVAPISDNPGK